MFHQLSYLIVHKIVGINCTYDEEQKEIYIYGLECFFVTVIPALFLILMGFFTHTLTYMIIWMIAFCTSRHNAGGYHAETDLKCMTMSCLMGTVNCLLVCIAAIPKSILFLTASVNLVPFMLLAPLETTKLQLTRREKRRKKISLIILYCVNIVFILLMPLKIAVSFTYALFCCSLLLIMGKMFR